MSFQIYNSKVVHWIFHDLKNISNISNLTLISIISIYLQQVTHSKKFLSKIF